MSGIPNDLLNIFHAGLDAVKGSTVVRKSLKKEYFSGSKFHVVAIGKAADSMLQGVAEDKIITALLISKHKHISNHWKIKANTYCLESDHPIPGDASLKAGQKLIAYLQKLPKKEPCLFLISGGTSSLVEVLDDGWSLSELTELTDYLLANAYPINEINAVRRRLSKIKGGGLWAYLGGRAVSCLLISDVPNDDPADIGSGLLFPSGLSAIPKIPEKWQKKIKTGSLVVNLKSFDWEVIASLSKVKEAIAVAAKEKGYQIRIIEEFIDGSALAVAQSCIKTLENNPNRLFIWGGETTVKLPKKAGKGGRNQHLALAAALAMDQNKETYFLVAGTDGTDGVTDATGALVSFESLEKGGRFGLDATDFLQRADSNTFFTKTNEIVVSGVTGTNVMDIFLGISVDQQN